MKFSQKCLMAIFAILFSFQFSNAQISFSHAAGGAYYIAGDAAAPGILYSPRLNFTEFGDMTLSIGTHVGGGIATNSREGASELVFDAPILLELNWGLGNGAGSNNDFGIFIGAGYGLSYVASSSIGTDTNSALGPVANIGARAIIKDQPVQLRISFLLNSKDGYGNVMSGGLSYFFGE